MVQVGRKDGEGRAGQGGRRGGRNTKGTRERLLQESHPSSSAEQVDACWMTLKRPAWLLPEARPQAGSWHKQCRQGRICDARLAGGQGRRFSALSETSWAQELLVSSEWSKNRRVEKLECGWWAGCVTGPWRSCLGGAIVGPGTGRARKARHRARLACSCRCAVIALQEYLGNQLTS